MYNIYVITNLINNKIYIGKTKNVTSRLRDHFKIARGGKLKYSSSYSYIHAAMNKYGFDNFSIETIISNIESEEDAFLQEIEKISSFKNDGYVLYNLTSGGDGTTGHKMTDAGKKRLSESKVGKLPWNKGKQTPQEVKDKISLALKKRYKKYLHPTKGKSSPLKGIKRSPEFGEKVSKSKKGIKFSKEHKIAMSILTENQVKDIKQMILNGVQNKEIAKIFGVHRDTISRIKNNKTWSD